MFDETGAVHGATKNGISEGEFLSARAELGADFETVHDDHPNAGLMRTIQHHMQMVVDHTAIGYHNLSFKDQAKLVTATQYLETAFLYLNKGMKGDTIHDGRN